MPNNNKPAVIGIDLGTTNSLAAIYEDGALDLIENDSLSTKLPSIIFSDQSGTLIGAQAEQLRLKQAKNCYYSFKRFMGSPYSTDSANLSYPLHPSKKGGVLIGDPPYQLTPEEASAQILKEIKQRAEKILNRKIKQAIITVPAYFEESGRQATINAAKLAGIDLLRLINEPTAAAIAYGLDQKSEAKILVYDLGGGTFDVTIIKLQSKLFRVLAVNGDNALGGDNFDQALYDYILEKLKLSALSLTPDKKAKLLVLCTQAKHELSIALEAKIDLSKFKEKFELTITREEFDKLISKLVELSIDKLKIAIQDAKLSKSEIDDVVLVGGSTRVPLVRKMVEAYFNKRANSRLDPDLVVAYGAAIQAANLSNASRKYLLMDVIPLSLGIETLGGVFAKLILKNTQLPAQIVEVFSTALDNQTSVELNIYQGEREMVKDCRLIGKLRLKGIPKMPAGLPKIQVNFSLDHNGVLAVKASETRSGKQANIEIIPEHGLSLKEVNKMIEDSIEHAKDDMKIRAEAELLLSSKTITQAVDKNQAKIKQLTSEADYLELLEILNKVKDLSQSQRYPELEISLNQLKELCRPLADQILSDEILSALK